MKHRMAATAVVAVGLTMTGTTSTVASTTHVFYLTARAGHCYIVSSHNGKIFTSVPCSNPRHDLEVYWTGHAGWGTSMPPMATAIARGRQVCITQYEKIDHGRYKSYNFFFADPGKEAAKYHDHLVCAHSTYPQRHALGAGWHVTG